MITMTEERRILRRQQIQRDRKTASQPWKGATPDQSRAYIGMDADGIPLMRTRFTAAQQRVYEKRSEIIEKLRAANSNNIAALAKEYETDERFIRWIDGRSRA
jgi:hypothetical protein